MGKFIEKKLTDADFAGKNIQSISGNTVLGQAAALKARFDSPAQVVMKEAFNALMDILESEDAAGSIGAPALSGTSGTTVGEQLKYLKELVAEAVLGQIADGSITDAKLSDAAAQIKARVSALEEDESKAPLDSPTFTGTPTAPTPGSGDNSTKLATTAFVAAALTLINTHLDNANVHVTAALKQAWNAHAANTANPHGVTAAQAGAVPNTRKVNNKSLSADIELTAADVGAAGGTVVSGKNGNITIDSAYYSVYDNMSFKMGNLVVFQMRLYGKGEWAANFTVGTVATGFKPGSKIYCTGMPIAINTDGTIVTCDKTYNAQTYTAFAVYIAAG